MVKIRRYKFQGQKEKREKERKEWINKISCSFNYDILVILKGFWKNKFNNTKKNIINYDWSEPRMLKIGSGSQNFEIKNILL